MSNKRNKSCRLESSIREKERKDKNQVKANNEESDNAEEHQTNVRTKQPWFHRIWRKVNTILKVACTAITLFGAISVRPNLTVKPSSVVLSPIDPFLNPFIFTNNNFYSLYVVESSCTLLELVKESMGVKDIDIKQLVRFPEVRSHASGSVYCDIPHAGPLGPPYLATRIRINVSYNVLGFGQSSETCFEGKANSTDQMIWLENPCPNTSQKERASIKTGLPR